MKIRAACRARRLMVGIGRPAPIAEATSSPNSVSQRNSCCFSAVVPAQLVSVARSLSNNSEAAFVGAICGDDAALSPI
ncbi:hypothetical protein [Actinomadura litoris]|uniref:hypothetical protein n=1 Tax=Actinomadura litoris TaxID=2678616 RepID=UPI001FA7B6F8|nr:hypothetical protein [Actinomadura litoris]